MKLLRPMKLCHESLKLKTSGTLLGLNVSKKYVDVSISDASKKVAAPLTVLVRTKKNVGLVGDFQSLISEFSVSGLVIGYPFEMEEGGRFTGLQVRRFVEDLAKTGKFEDMNYTFWNVNSESKIVAPMLQTLGWDWYRIMAYVDQYAALEFLQLWLEISEPPETSSTTPFLSLRHLHRPHSSAQSESVRRCPPLSWEAPLPFSAR